MNTYIPVKPMRPSTEGVNQEIEGLVLKSLGYSSDPDHQVEDKVCFVYGII